MVSGTFVQGEADIYTNPPAQYEMYCRAEKEKSRPGVSLELPATGGAAGGAFVQGEAAETYTNPPAHYQMYRRVEKSRSGVSIELPATSGAGGAFVQGEAAETYTNPPANYQMYPRTPAAFAEDQKTAVAPLTPTTVGTRTSSTVASPRSDVSLPEFGSLIGAAFIQGEADIYKNPPSNYRMYPRKLAAPEEDAVLASAALTPAKVTCPPTKTTHESALIGGAFIQGEADIYSNPPANYQMYPRTLRNSPTGLVEKKQDLSTLTPSAVEFLQQRLQAKMVDFEELVVGVDVIEAVERQECKSDARKESKSTVASDSDMLAVA